MAQRWRDPEQLSLARRGRHGEDAAVSPDAVPISPGQPAAGAPAAALPPLVLVAGLAGSGAWWAALRPQLAAGGRQVETIDLPGFGARGGYRRLLAIEAQAGWLAERLTAAAGRAGAVGAEAGGAPAPVDLVGYSLGGAVAIRVAAARPQLVRRLVLVSPSGVPSGRGALADAAALAHAALLAGPGFWPLLARDVARAGLRGVLAAGRDVRADDARALLPRIVAPTLVVWGDRDRLVLRSDVEQIAAGILDARLETFAGCGHVPMAECPQRLAAVVAGFLAG